MRQVQGLTLLEKHRTVIIYHLHQLIARDRDRIVQQQTLGSQVPLYDARINCIL